MKIGKHYAVTNLYLHYGQIEVELVFLKRQGQLYK